MKADQFKRFLDFLQRLDKARISYKLEHSRDDAVMVVAFAPGEYWEIEFLEDGAVDIERFRSDGEILDESALAELFALCSDDEASATGALQHDNAARK